MNRPQIYQMTAINDEMGSALNCTYLFVAASQDYRAYEVIRKALRLESISTDRVILFHYNTRKETAQSGDPYYDYTNMDLVVDEVDCDINDPGSILPFLEKFHRQILPGQTIALDISCFTKPFFFYIIKFLKERVTCQAVSVFYTEPATYIFSSGLYDSYQSTSGTLQIVEVPGFTGHDTDTSSSLLVILLGFDGKLATVLATEIEPNEIILVNGFPSYLPVFKDISLINNERLVAGRENPVVYYARANNPFEVYNLLEHLRGKYLNAFLSIAALGTKPMALGACLFAALNPDVRLVYPLPEKYSDITTDKCSTSWLYVLPLRSSNSKPEAD